MRIDEKELINMSTQELEELLQIITNIQMDRRVLHKKEIISKIQKLIDEADELGTFFVKDYNTYGKIRVYLNDNGDMVFSFES
jgi:hypothetical protein